MKAVVIIPVYGAVSAITAAEQNSIKNYYKILQNYNIVFVAPTDFDTVTFSTDISKVGTCKWEFFDKVFFESVHSYSRLMCSKEFYQRFKKYECILIAQTDAWVFKDELENWCAKGYDYIGAPWFKGWNKGTGNTELIGVGNGGFSLRNNQKAIQITRRIYLLQKINSFWNRSGIHNLISYKSFLQLTKSFFHISDINAVAAVLKPVTEFEDYFWTFFIAKAFTDFNVAPVEEAMYFSFEVNPSYLYKLTGNQLPFGCHAWQKYEPDFWTKYIPAE